MATVGHEELRLSGGTALCVNEDVVRLSGDELVIVRNAPAWLISCVRLLEKGTTLARLREVARGESDLEPLLQEMIERRLVIRNEANPWGGTRFERNAEHFMALGLSAAESQRVLERCTIGILGLGGTGSVVLQHLMAAGIRSFALIDSDCVEPTNLNRQFIFSPADVGKPKVRAAREYVERSIEASSVRTKRCHVGSRRDLEEALGDVQLDMLVLAADQPVGRITEIVAAVCARRGAHFIGGGCGVRRHHWGPLLSPVDCERLARELARERADTHTELGLPIRASFGTTNTIVGAHMAHDIIHFLVGRSAESASSVMSLSFDPISIERIPWQKLGDPDGDHGSR